MKTVSGGSWVSLPVHFRSAFWDWNYTDIGFRITGRPRFDSDRRVIRGGSWVSLPVHFRSAYRKKFNTDRRANFLGFRLIGRVS